MGKNFPKGHIPWNKGLKTGLVPKSAFKKGDNLGEKHWKWRGAGRKDLCECGTLKVLRSKTCLKCSGLKRAGEKAYQWKGGKATFKERRRNIDRIMRMKRRGVLGMHSTQQWEDLKKAYDYMCLCCKKQEPEIKLTIDHIIPLSKGGTDNIENIQPLCKSCNCIKFTKIINFRINEQIYGFQSSSAPVLRN